MECLFDVYGIYSEDYLENVLIFKLSEKMFDVGFFFGDDEGVIIIYDCVQVLVCEDMQFFIWEYLMVQGGMDLVLFGLMGNILVVLIKNKVLKFGIVLFEFLFVSEVVVLCVFQFGCWLLFQVLCCLFDVNGNDLVGWVFLEIFNDQLESVLWVSVNKFVQVQCDVLVKQFDVVEGKIVLCYEECVVRVKQQFVVVMDEELVCLIVFKVVNLSVCDSELDSLCIQCEEGLVLFDKVFLCFEVICILVVG